MKAWIPALLITVVAAWVIQDQIRQPTQRDTERMSGMDFVVPPEYTPIELGESTLAQVAQRLLQERGESPKVAAVFTASGDRVHLLVNRPEDFVQHNVAGRTGVLKQTTWPGSVERRLLWAAENGNLAAPEMSGAKERNAYH